eukprot:365453-Pyramimonas_sp.AAC.1
MTTNTVWTLRLQCEGWRDPWVLLLLASWRRAPWGAGAGPGSALGGSGILASRFRRSAGSPTEFSGHWLRPLFLVLRN